MQKKLLPGMLRPMHKENITYIITSENRLYSSGLKSFVDFAYSYHPLKCTFKKFLISNSNILHQTKIMQVTVTVHTNLKKKKIIATKKKTST